MNYDAWLADHIAAFNLPVEAVATFLQWQTVFTEDYTEAELRAATQALIRNRVIGENGKPVLKYAENHRIAIQEAIERIRLEQQYPASKSTAVTDCTLCGRSGYVEVPHPLRDPDSRTNAWHATLELRIYSANASGNTYQTIPVLCNCAVGSRMAANQRASFTAGTRKDVQLTLERYAKLYPNWREIMALIVAARLANAEAASKPKPRKKAGAK